MDNKNHLITFLQTFGIILVVVRHSFQGCPTDVFEGIWTYSFNMPLFMFISGYLSSYVARRKNTDITAVRFMGSGGMIAKKAKRLLLPYVAISSLAFIPKAALNSIAMRSVDLSLAGYLKSLVYPWDNTIIFFWFLPTIFIIILLTAGIMKHLARHTANATTVLLAAAVALHVFNPLDGIMLLNLSGVDNYLMFFVLGYFVDEKGIMDILKKHPYAYFAGSMAALAVLYNVPEFPFVRTLVGIFGIVMSISLGNIYLEKDWHAIDYFYGASYAIYLFSWFPQSFFQNILLKTTGTPWQVGTALAIASGMLIPTWIYFWIKKHKDSKAGRLIALISGH